MMDWLVPTLTTTLVGTLVLALVYIYLYSQFRQKCLIFWAAGWTVLALRLDRPFRKALPEQQALQQISASSGTFFDPRVVEAFLLIVSG